MTNEVLHVFRAHPSFGLRVVGEREWPVVFPLSEDDYEATWHCLGDAEQEQKEESFFGNLFRLLCENADANVELEFFTRKEQKALLDRIKTFGGPAFQSMSGHRLRGRVTPKIVEEIVRSHPVMVQMWIQDDLRLTMHDDWGGVVVRLTDGEARAVRGT